MEDGEIIDSRAAQHWNHRPRPGDVYDPAYEWPGESSTAVTLDATISEYQAKEPRPSAPQKHHTNTPSLRLVVLRTSILPRKHKLAIIDGYSELQLGRDAPLADVGIPRVRLKEMEVSKLHATVYWDAQRLEWSVVDMGSKHGTFLRSASSTSSSSNDVGPRLSPPRMASVPKQLRHLDRLTLGSTTFVIHIHKDKVPCDVCSPADGDEIQIPLFHSTKATPTNPQKRTRESAGLETLSCAPKPERDAKKALTMLKHNLLARHEQAAPRSQSPSDDTQYIDRSARRRALHPSSHSDSPGVQPAALITMPSERHNSPVLTPDMRTPSLEPVSKPATPLPSSNIGHRLLMKQGWAPGMVLGTSDQGFDEGRTRLVQPLEINPTANRAGLGSKEIKDQTAPNANWKEKGMYQRWTSLKREE
ncbi:hypothetical protein F5887DRAFT_947752 [Amanita rubescens]|nr:hypothetical protein F5887DRAFT_947752 [Amanita rubescens]